MVGDSDWRRGTSRRAWLKGVAASSAALLISPAWASAAVSGAARSPRDEAIQSIPWNKLAADDKQRVADVINDSSVFRRLPTQTIDCDPTLYLFLVEHPDLVVDVWRVLGMSQISMRRSGDGTFRADDHAGTVGNVSFLLRSHDVHLVYGDGYYEGPLFNRKVRGKCVLLLKSAYVRETDGRYYVTCRMDAFVQMENLGADLVARTFQPLMGPIADHNFRETAVFLGSMSLAAQRNPGGLQQLSGRLSTVDPDTRTAFSQLTEEVALRAAEAENAQQAVVRRPSSEARR